MRLSKKSDIENSCLQFESNFDLNTPKSPKGDLKSLPFRGGLEG